MKKEDTDFLILDELVDDIPTLFPTLIERDERYPIPLQSLYHDFGLALT